MVPTLSLGISDFTLADSANLAGPTPQCPTALSSSGSLRAVNGRGLTLRPFPSNRSKHDFSHRRRVSPAARRQRRGGRGECQ
jgi:hypothetical protein